MRGGHIRSCPIGRHLRRSGWVASLAQAWFWVSSDPGWPLPWRASSFTLDSFTTAAAETTNGHRDGGHGDRIPGAATVIIKSQVLILPTRTCSNEPLRVDARSAAKAALRTLFSQLASAVPRPRSGKPIRAAVGLCRPRGKRVVTGCVSCRASSLVHDFGIPRQYRPGDTRYPASVQGLAVRSCDRASRPCSRRPLALFMAPKNSGFGAHPILDRGHVHVEQLHESFLVAPSRDSSR